MIIRLVPPPVVTTPAGDATLLAVIGEHAVVRRPDGALHAFTAEEVLTQPGPQVPPAGRILRRGDPVTVRDGQIRYRIVAVLEDGTAVINDGASNRGTVRLSELRYDDRGSPLTCTHPTMVPFERGMKCGDCGLSQQAIDLQKRDRGAVNGGNVFNKYDRSTGSWGFGDPETKTIPVAEYEMLVDVVRVAERTISEYKESPAPMADHAKLAAEVEHYRKYLAQRDHVQGPK